MPLLYYRRPDNYRRDLEWGAGFHLNQATARLHDVDLGDSLWAFTRASDGRYALAAELVVRAKTRNPAGFRYGSYRLWGDLTRSRYFDVEAQPRAAPVDFSPLQALSPDIASQATLSADSSLSLKPGGPPTIPLANNASAVVNVVGSQGEERRIAWWGENALIVGWVPEARLGPGGLVVREHLDGGLGEGVGTRRVGERLRCETELALIAELGAERAAVGQVLAGTPVGRGPADGALTEVTLPTLRLTLRPEARLLVATDALEACTPSQQ